MAIDRPHKKSTSIRVNRSNPRLRQREDGNSRQGIRVSRKIVRPIRIGYPMGGAEIEAATVSLRGTANPGDTLQLEGTGVTCKVNADGSWAMPGVHLRSGDQELAVVDVEHPSQTATVSVFVSPLPAISIIAPLQGETLEARFIEVTGKASPQRLVCLRLGRTVRTERAGARGSFRFADVELTDWGQQRLALYYAEDPSHGAPELVVHWPGLDLPSLVDPVTRAQLEPGADVVRCSGCYTYCYRATWDRLRKCPRCAEPTGPWARSAPRFHTPRKDLTTG